MTTRLGLRRAHAWGGRRCLCSAHTGFLAVSLCVHAEKTGSEGFVPQGVVTFQTYGTWPPGEQGNDKQELSGLRRRFLRGGVLARGQGRAAPPLGGHSEGRPSRSSGHAAVWAGVAAPVSGLVAKQRTQPCAAAGAAGPHGTRP